jgi:hypothetical protein
MNSRWRCKECNGICDNDQLLWGKSPFSDTGLCGCPHCKSVECVEQLCDEPGCLESATCGWPTGNGGYRRTCYAHSKFAKEKE